MITEQQLAGWTKPSSDSEQDKQDRTVRMVRDAVAAHRAFADCSLSVYAKGSYPNNTNVRTDSDVDIAVQCHEAMYWEEATPGTYTPGNPYAGLWTPQELRFELGEALKARFSGQVDVSGSTAILVRSSSARVDADVVPCFDYRYFVASGGHRDGAKTFRNPTGDVINYPVQHLEQGRAKNTATNGYFKQTVRILKRVENLMHAAKKHRAVPSYFVECLVYNCPNSVLLRDTWTETVKGVLAHIWDQLDGPEPDTRRWMEVNGIKYLFHQSQKWTRQDGRDFAFAAWNYLERG